MKSRKTVTHVNLMNEVTRQLSEKFIPDPQAIKKRIESLIEVNAPSSPCVGFNDVCFRGNTLTERRTTGGHMFTRHSADMFCLGAVFLLVLSPYQMSVQVVLKCIHMYTTYHVRMYNTTFLVCQWDICHRFIFQVVGNRERHVIDHYL